eukprot:CAMPEP_0172487608 /NCGR_PEP_ID=MMETSP1066-20121228/16735_1 /TAXON_ID=671091 /ORGANISM="Coscinodiscus wailesii, Strain CCMP2513" /LENGTH=792 /DNA_ID=CAMNT_0013254313 /DNA_START=67 /DNA_END=2445 /DNA_ORIENTATION=+
MRTVVCSILALICFLQHSTYAATTGPINYILSEGSVKLDDVATEFQDIQTIFNGKEFAVSVDLAWSESENVINTTSTLKWIMYVDGVKSSFGEEAIDNTRTLPGSISTGEGVVNKSGEHTISVEVTFNDETISTERKYQSYAGGVSVLPLIALLFLAVTTQMVELSLGFGVFIGACMVAGNLKDGFKSTLDNYFLLAAADIWHMYVLFFGLFMSGLVGMIQKSGGLAGFTRFMGQFARTSRTGQAIAMCTGFVIFFDDYANILVAGAAMRPILDSLSVSREKLAFIVDATAAPVASLVPISSWVAYEVGLIQDEINNIIVAIGGEENLTIEKSAFSVFLRTIAYRYYSIFMLLFMAMLIISQRDWGPMLIAERKVIVYGRKDGGPGKSLATASETEELSKNAPSPDTPQRAWNMLVPMLVLVFYIFYIMFQTGSQSAPTSSFIDIISYSDSYSALLWGTMGAALTTLILYMMQFKKDGQLVRPTLSTFFPKFNAKNTTTRTEANWNDDEDDKYPPKFLMTPREAMDSFLIGMGKIFPAVIILTLAWASGSIMKAVGLNRLCSQLIVGSSLDPGMLPTISFIVSVFIAFATGTSWGTMAIMFPLMLRPSYIVSNGDPEIFYGVIAGVLSGAVAGDHTSPISDTTVLSSMATECGLLEHVKTQGPYALVAIVWAIIVGTIPVGMKAYNTGVAILMGFIVNLIFILVIAVRVINPTGKYDLFTEIVLSFRHNDELAEIRKDVVTAYETQIPVPMKKDVFDKEVDTEQGGVVMIQRTSDKSEDTENICLEMVMPSK